MNDELAGYPPDTQLLRIPASLDVVAQLRVGIDVSRVQLCDNQDGTQLLILTKAPKPELCCQGCGKTEFMCCCWNPRMVEPRDV